MNKLNWVNKHKERKFFSRLLYALLHSISGINYGFKEKAFLLESILFVALFPAIFICTKNWVEALLLLGTMVLVLVTELLNTAIECVVDRMGLEWHFLAKKAKDLGSAAVFLTLVLSATCWALAIYNNA